jgi:hypothetical protein
VPERKKAGTLAGHVVDEEWSRSLYISRGEG